MGENGIISGSVFRQKVCLLHTHRATYMVYIYSTVGWSVVSTYDLGGIFTMGCIHIAALDLTTVLYAILVW